MTTDPQAEFTAELAERTVLVTWPDNERGGATPPPDGWADRALDSESTLHEVDEGSISGCSALRWRDDPRPDAELVAASLALVTGVPAAVSPPPATDRAGLREQVAEALMRWAEGNNDPQYARMRRSETVRANAYGRADAVLSVLSTDGRAAAYGELADRQTQLAVADDLARRRDVAAARRQFVKELRRLAAGERDEQQAQQGETQAALPCQCGHGEAYHDFKYGGPRCRLCPESGEWTWRHAFRSAVASQPEEVEAPSEPVHARPGPDDNGVSPCCGRPPFEFRGERLTRDPAAVTCTTPPAVVAEPGKEDGHG